MKNRQVVVVGGGASGLIAAIAAAREGADVTIIEQKEKLGKKILSTGNGKCNLTNEKMQADCFRGDDTAIVESVLEQFGYEDTIRFFEELGVLFKNRQGYLYPISEQASAIVDVLSMEVERRGISVMLKQSVIGIEKKKKCFEVKTENTRYHADAVVLSTGGKAASVLGSDGSGYTLAKSFGHRLSPVVPALVQLKGKGTYFKQVAGVRTQAKVSLYVEEVLKASDTGELQLTNYGISGIPVFQISRYAAKGIYEKKRVRAEIDFLPVMSEAELETFLQERRNRHGEKTSEQFFVGIWNQKLTGMLLKQAQIPLHIKAADIREEKWERLLWLCKHFSVEIEDTNPFEQAQVCAGGIRTAEINPNTLESLYAEKLYLTGELLDIDGICGGYNLQWAWSTGYIAGICAAKNTGKGK